MDRELIVKIKEKKVFSKIPDELVWKFLRKNNLDVKETRSDIRKFLGVFLTNKVLKGTDESILKSHISSKDRDYGLFYQNIFEGINNVKSLVDLGCGANGFSYNFLKESLGEVDYIGIEAVGQLVDKMNFYFKEKNIRNANVIRGDLLDLDKTLDIINNAKSPKIIFLLQVIDALENLEKDYSKKLLLKLKDVLEKGDFIIISMPLRSISGRKKLESDRSWLSKFIDINFESKKEKENGNEKIIILKI